MIMALHYSRNVLQLAVAQICIQLGWDAVHSTSLELLTCILERYLFDLGKNSHHFSELFGRTQPNFDDLGLAFHEQHVNLNELQAFVKLVDLTPLSHDILRFPEPKASYLTCQLEDLKNEQKIDDDLVTSVDLEDGCGSLRSSLQDSSFMISSPLAVTSAASYEKRLPGLSSPTESMPSAKRLRLLPDEAAHSQYEMKSFIRTDSGVLYPKGQGKVADSHSHLVHVSAADDSHARQTTETDREVVLKQLISKANKDRAKPRLGTAKNFPADHELSDLPDFCGSKSLVAIAKKGFEQSDVMTEIYPDERLEKEIGGIMHQTELMARETRLTAYEDAIDAVIRKAQAVQNDEHVIQETVKFDSNSQRRNFADGLGFLHDTKRVEREARIDDTINSVVAQAVCLSPAAEDEEVVDILAPDPLDEKLNSSCGTFLQSPSVLAVSADKSSNDDLSNQKADVTAAVECHIISGKPAKIRKIRRKSQQRHVYDMIKSSYTSADCPENKISKCEKVKESFKHKSEKKGNSKVELGARFGTGAEDEDSRLPMAAAAESLMTLAGVVSPATKRLRISIGCGKERTVDSLHVSDDRFSENATVSLVPQLDNSSLSGENPSESKHQQVQGNQTNASAYNISEFSEMFMEDKLLKKSVISKVEHRKSKRRVKKHKEQKLQERIDKKEKIPSIPKMTIKFGGGLSGGTPNSMHVSASDSTRCGGETVSQAPLKIVIRPFTNDSTAGSVRRSPHTVIKIPKHQSTVLSDSQTGKHGQMFCLSGSGNKGYLSPAQFTSSSSSSSGSPYRDMSAGLPRTPTPPSLTSPAPVLSSGSPQSVLYSPLQSSSSRSRSPSPPTLYRSPEMDNRTSQLVNVCDSIGKTVSSLSPAESSLVVPSVSAVLAKQVVPALPPPSGKTGFSSKSAKNKQLVITETVSKIVDESGKITWICPACKMPDDGSAMIGCDICDDWYHWPCVGIVKEPPDEEQWFCKRCADSNTFQQIGKRGKNARRKTVNTAVKVRSKKSLKKK